MGTHSLKRMITNYSLLEILFTVFMMLIFVLSFNLSIQLGLTYPANYPEKQLPILTKKAADGTLNPDDIPSVYQYRINEGGKIRQTIPHQEESLIKEALEKGSSSQKALFFPKTYAAIPGPQQLVVSYRIIGSFTNPTVDRFLPPPDITYTLVLFFLWLFGFLALVRRNVRKIQTELNKIDQTNKKIKQLNLDYVPQTSRITEIKGLLDSLNNMRDELRTALETQWALQKQQENLIQTVTHDIRTPITLIKGNHELLAENLTEDQQELLADAQHGVKRLEEYVEQLKTISGLAKQIDKQPITAEILTNWIALAKELSKSKQLTIILQKQDATSLSADISQLTNALQNILINSIEQTEPGGTLILAFEDTPAAYRISVADSGPGFSNEALERGTERFYSTKKQTDTAHFGLGLAIAKDVLMCHHGQLLVENLTENGHISGAKTTMVLAK